MTDATTHIFRVSLRAKLYRDIEIPSNRSLYDLAEAIVRPTASTWTTPSGSFPS